MCTFSCSPFYLEYIPCMWIPLIVHIQSSVSVVFWCMRFCVYNFVFLSFSSYFHYSFSTSSSSFTSFNFIFFSYLFLLFASCSFLSTSFPSLLLLPFLIILLVINFLYLVLWEQYAIIFIFSSYQALINSTHGSVFKKDHSNVKIQIYLCYKFCMCWM